MKRAIALAWLALAPWWVTVPAWAELPQCQTEDGSDIDGYCLWTDPDTGNVYLNPTPAELGGTK